MGYTSYYTFGLPTFVVVVIGLYALFTSASYFRSHTKVCNLTGSSHFDACVIYAKSTSRARTVSATQALARRSTSVASLKRPVPTLGLRLALASVSV